MSNNSVKIGSSIIGNGYPCFLAAEAGTTCNGDINLAKELIDAAAEAGFDAIKFQTIGPEANISDPNTVYKYKTATGWAEENMYEMFKDLVFSENEWQEIASHTRSKGLIFFSTTDYLEGVNLLERCDVPLHKNGSWDITYAPLVKKMAETGKPLMLDLGPATLPDILTYINICKLYGNGEVILLHDFHTEDPLQMNMRNIPYLKDVLGIPVGFSAPGRNTDLDIAAISLGADMIEKRITLDAKTQKHHHFLSLETSELKPWVERIRFAEASLGSREVRPPAADLEDAKKYYRSLCTTRAIKCGELFTPENLDGKRPGTGITTRHLEIFLGRSANRNLDINTLLSWEDI